MGATYRLHLVINPQSTVDSAKNESRKFGNMDDFALKC